MSKFLKSKTIWFSMILSVLGVIQTDPSYAAIFDPETYGKLMIAIGIVIAILRSVTTDSIKDK